MTCRSEVVTAFDQLALETRRLDFSPAEIVQHMKARGSTYAESSIRTHVIAHLVADGTLVRTSRARYRLGSGYPQQHDPPPATPAQSPTPRVEGYQRGDGRWHEVNVQENVRVYLLDRRGDARYSSYDYCFNYFRSHFFNYFRSHFERGTLPAIAEAPLVEQSCLQLGFYLASWGMFRGRSLLLQQSAKFYEAVLHTIIATPTEIWTIDVGRYSPQARALVLETSERLRAALGGAASDTLTTKVMLGVFGCVPAFDRYFRAGFGVSTFSDRSLRLISEFHGENTAMIEAARVPTLDFRTGCPTDIRYTEAKVMDMVFFVEGLRRGGSNQATRD